MSKSKPTQQKPGYAQFTGVYCSGYFINDPALVTALCLLFDRIYIPNHLRYLPDDLKQSSFKFEFEEWVKHAWTSFSVSSVGAIKYPDSNGYSVNGLNMLYLQQAIQFYIQYRPLFDGVLDSDLFANSKVQMSNTFTDRSGKIVYDRRQGYYMPMVTITEYQDDPRLDQVLQSGGIPILSNVPAGVDMPSGNLRSSQIATLLALRSMGLVLPLTKPATAEDILDAREHLKDELPLFWAGMLRLTGKFDAWLKEDIAEKDLEHECEEYINTTIRPSLIEVRSHLMRDHKQWAKKVAYPVAEGVEMGIASTSISIAGLLGLVIRTAVKIRHNFTTDEFRDVDPIIAFLVKLNKRRSK